MRKSIQRALALAGAVPALAGSLVVGSTTTAHAAPICPFGTELAEFDFVVGGHYRVAAAAVSPTEYNLCIHALSEEQAVVVLKTGVAFTAPSITNTPGTGSCATQIINMTSPVDFQLSYGVSTSGPKICLGRDFQTTTLSFNMASVNALPDVDIWLPADSATTMYGYCGAQYATYVASPTSTNYYNWYYCYSYDRRVI